MWCPYISQEKFIYDYNFKDTYGGPLWCTTAKQGQTKEEKKKGGPKEETVGKQVGRYTTVGR
jgi:hypothetical protein